MPGTDALIGDAGPLPVPPKIDRRQDSIFLDFDGTLAAIEATPDAVRLTPATLAALERARHALDGRLAIISGRSLAALDGLVAAPALCMAGVHGLERRAATGAVMRMRASEALEAARVRLQALGEREPRLLIEDKGLGVAVHYRQAPDLEGLARREASAIADEHGLMLQTGKMVYEIRDRGADKGAAVQAFMAEPPFTGTRPIFVGDDDTDEIAFRAAADLGGFGILVGQPRATAARYGLADIDAVRAWLETVGAAA